MKDIKNSSRKCGRRRPLNHISRRAFGFNKIEIALYVLLDSLSDFIRTYSRLLRSSNCGSAVLDLCRSVRSTLKPFRFWRSLTSQRVYNIVICNIFASPTMAKAPQKQAHFLFSNSRKIIALQYQKYAIFSVFGKNTFRSFNRSAICGLPQIASLKISLNLSSPETSILTFAVARLGRFRARGHITSLVTIEKMAKK